MATAWAQLASDASIFASKVALNAKEYGVKGDGTDDTDKIQEFVAEAQGTVSAGTPGVDVVFPSGEYVISDTITYSRLSGMVRGQGQGQSPRYLASPGRGTVFRWNGPANKPMFKVLDSLSLEFSQFRLEGKDAAQPTHGIEFNSAGGTSGTNELLTVRNVWIGGHSWSSQGVGKGLVQSGIGFTGANANNDQFSLENVVFSHCTDAGLDLPNSQSIWGQVVNPFFNTCGVGVRTSANVSLYNASFTDCTIDATVDAEATLLAYGWFSERSLQIFDILNSGGMHVYGGHWLIGDPMQGAAYFARAANLRKSLTLDGVQVLYQITPEPPLSVTGTYSPEPYVISIRGCLGLGPETLSEVIGYGAPDVTTLDINTGGVSYRGSITGHAPKAYIQTKTASYSLTQADRVIIANGSSLSINLPDPTISPIDREFVIKNIAATSVTVASLGTSKTIDGAATKTLAQWAVGHYVSDGTQWLSV